MVAKSPLTSSAQIEAEELQALRTMVGEKNYASRQFETAATILDQIITDEQFVEFLTLPAYRYLA